MISLIQTAEGALNETHAILQRMRELANQAANDTNNEADRGELQKEIDQLAQALNDISNDTEFNTKTLLDGSLQNAVFHVGANKGQNLKVSINDMSGTALDVAKTYGVDENGEIDGLTYKPGQEAQKAQGYTASTTGDTGSEVHTIELEDGTIATFDNTGGTAGYYTTDGKLVLEAETELSDGTTGTIEAKEAVQGGYYDADDKLVITADEELSAGTVTVGINISTQENADGAITTIQSAIDRVSAERSKLGAVQNRLEHTINNLGASAENLTAAESRIRDVDMAKEMMEFTKNNILTQAAQAMLAQANQTPQGVLQLLR